MPNKSKSSRTGKSGNLALATVNALDNLEGLAAAIEEARRDSLGKILGARPDGAFSAMEYARSLHLPRETARRQLRALWVAGGYERFVAYEKDPAGRTQIQTFYRKVKSK